MPLWGVFRKPVNANPGLNRPWGTRTFNSTFKDVRAHCHCASLVRTLYMTWHAPRHIFQARAPSRNSTKYRLGDLCSNLICEYFCWMLGDPHCCEKCLSHITEHSRTGNHSAMTHLCKNLPEHSIHYVIYSN